MLKTNYNIEKYSIKHGNKHLPEQLSKWKTTLKFYIK